MPQFLATFEILLSGQSTTIKHHKSFSCNFFGGRPIFFHIHIPDCIERTSYAAMSVNIGHTNQHPSLLTMVSVLQATSTDLRYRSFALRCLRQHRPITSWRRLRCRLGCTNQRGYCLSTLSTAQRYLWQCTAALSVVSANPTVTRTSDRPTVRSLLIACNFFTLW